MEELTRERIGQMDVGELADNVISIYDLKDPVRRSTLAVFFEERAKQLGVQRSIQRLMRDANTAESKLATAYTEENANYHTGINLKYDSNGKPSETIDNYVAIFRGDSYFDTIRYNLFTVSAEVTENMKTRQWSDADDSAALQYIEGVYHLYNEPRYQHAMRVLKQERSYHPIREYIDSLKWDGTPRIEELLIKWMRCDDTPYTREVSRLIFAGGIHRIFDPGCKFDCVPVLIGTRQGEGKSTFVRWLSIKDSWYGELTEFDGQKGVEAVQGTWICEVGELLALVRAKEVESIKGYFSRQVDKYRAPYDRHTSTFQRQCVFVGTTNKERFLTDKTGNRRFFPIHVHTEGHNLFAQEKQCREYIIQCWAEARAKFDDSFTCLAPDRSLTDTILEKQQAAEEDDWREGMIEDYLSSKSAGDSVCAVELYQEALQMGSLSKPTPAESGAIGLIMQKFPMWKRTSKALRFRKYGVTRAWTLEGEQDELPF